MYEPDYCAKDTAEIQHLMNKLGVVSINPVPDPIQNSVEFRADGRLVSCDSDKLLPKLRELAQIKLLEDKAKATISFGGAIAALKNGNRVAREGWNGKGMWLNLQVPDSHSKMTLPYIYMFTADKKQVPWLASQTDMLSDDWEIIK